ncbi:SDR family NAD(P)-dependent oxidoreductase [Streptosporangium lutulentum]|uniref:NAD(P)-dependent dehydrogenase (Short-subunit alcohol dehydrogenase family) n=1 Tax=Streptosporangium lutulentum TaxID=1461250 RepID=A0ABT9QJ10_9ACTN|nr:SDR family NAD(P)-dependent oxidoreductase [Streptosporangium lutulentum]MDP9846288.1 NAD(P)-dependent dehydrogenase (short-subunit alcohol dehydrogenase family) [Streptosporangium lutulentum]
MAVWFVTGAARGIGHRVAREALRRGHRVVATGRDLAAVTDAFDGVAGEVLPVELDLLRPEAPASAVEQAMRRFGRIDVLVHAASRTVRDPLQETTDAQARALFDVNVVGMLAVTRAVLPVLSAQRAGRIIAVGSAAGFSTPAGSGLYGASMAAVEALCETLRAELDGFGVCVTVVELGRFATLPTAFDRGPLPPGDPYKAASAILDLLTVDDPPLRLQLGADAVAHVEAKLERVSQELDLWRPVSLGTVFDLDLPRQNGHRPPRDT